MPQSVPNTASDPHANRLAPFRCRRCCLGSATAALAEKRIFIIANSPDAYGVDRCLSSGAACGAAAAAAYCESKQFTTAASYRKIDRDEITGAVPTGGSLRPQRLRRIRRDRMQSLNCCDL